VNLFGYLKAGLNILAVRNDDIDLRSKHEIKTWETVIEG